MQNIEVDWTGMAEMKAALNDIHGNVGKANREGIISLASLVESGAKNNFAGAHRRGQPHVGGDKPNIVTGNLRRSIQRSPVVNTGDNDFMVQVYPTARYSRAVEMGNPKSNSRAFPYLAPAVSVMAKRANDIMTAAWSRYI